RLAMSNRLPMTTKSSKSVLRPVLRPYTTLAELADYLTERYDEIVQKRRHVLSLRYGDASQLPSACVPDESEFRISDHVRETLNRAQVLLARLDPEDAYEPYRDEAEDTDGGDDGDEGGNLKRDVIAKRLAIMLGSFPGGAVADPDAFLEMLLQHVAAANI